MIGRFDSARPAFPLGNFKGSVFGRRALLEQDVGQRERLEA